MKKIKITTLLFCILLFSHPVLTQNYTVSPIVPDFMDLNASCVVATYGMTNDPFLNTGVLNGRHTVITQQGTDPNTGNNLALLPDNARSVVKLGNQQTGAEAESITYHFIADADKSILLLRFAVVFEDPGHDLESQSRFVIRIMNAAGDLIESCAEYNVSARPGIDGFQDYNEAGTPIRWRDWTNVGLDMSAYAGQEVQVQIITYDCDYSGHFGYAYFTASCISNKLALGACDGNNFTAIAPEGFPSYLWHNGETTPSTRWTLGDEAMNLSCEITSATGCRFTLSGYVSNAPAPPVSETIYDTICEGDPYTKHYYNLPPQHKAGNFTYYNTFFDLTNCNANITNTLFLNVQKRFYPIEAWICQGTDYTENGFNIRQPSLGTHYDTIKYSSTVGCDSIITLKLFVDFGFNFSNNITGDAHPCSGPVTTYSIPTIQGLGKYNWSVPENYFILEGQGTGTISVLVTDRSTVGDITLHASNGCGNGTVSLEVTPFPSYWRASYDSICSNEAYHREAFHIPPQDSSGIYSFSQYYKTAAGCDSVTTLRLHVFPSVSTRILVADSVICPGDRVSLEAIGKSEDTSIGALPIVPGDILCTDGNIVKQSHYKVSGKTALGVVFWVDKSGWHGWAVNLVDGPAFASTKNQKQSSYRAARPLYPTSAQALLDTAGYDNSLADGTLFGDWYLPALGQLYICLASVHQINAALSIIGQASITEWIYYLSSTKDLNNRNWSISSSHYLPSSIHPPSSTRIRYIRTF